MRTSFIASTALAVLALAVPALAGPPVVCHPFEIGSAKSLPADSSNWLTVRSDYDFHRVVADTEALLTPSTPTIVRMETLRRAALYASLDRAVAEQLIAAMMLRVKKAEQGGSMATAYIDVGGNVPNLPSASQLDQVKSAIKTAHFDLYSGKDDHILRRLTVNLSIVPPAGQGNGVSSVDVTLDVTLGKVNESQTINAPSGAKPLSALLSQLGVNGSSLGALGALGGVPGAGIAGAGTPTSPPSGAPSGAAGGASAAQLQKYLKCVQKSSNPTSCQSLRP